MAQDRPLPRPDDPYEVLQVDPGADLDVIEAAYRVLARRYHPDRNRSPEATRQMARINVAWELLSDPDRRRAYDRSLGAPPPVRPYVPGSPAPSGEGAAPSPGATAGPVLRVIPDRIDAGRMRRGAVRRIDVGVETEPAGIRVALAVSQGADWLHVSPSLLQALNENQALVRIHTGRLPAGRHSGAVELSTSWETRLLPVAVEVAQAGPLYRSLALLRHGPAPDGGRAALLALALPVLLVVAIAAALAFVALAR